MEFSEKVCIGCIPTYTYGDYVYVNNNIYAPKEHHNRFMLNQGPYFYITPLSKFMDDTLTLLSKLFFN